MTRRHAAGSRAELIGLGWALGLALFTACYFALYLAGVPSSATVVPALVAAAGGVALLVRLVTAARAGEAGNLNLRLKASPASRYPRQMAPEGAGAGRALDPSGSHPCHGPSGPGASRLHIGSRSAALGGLGLAALQVALAAWMAVRSPLASWDAWSFWALKARMFALGGPRPGYYHDPVTLYTHPDYPLNLPLAEAALFRLPGHAGLQLAALIGPACLAALLLLYYAGLGRLYGRAAAGLATMALAAIPALVTQAAGGNADIPLALYLGGASLYLFLWWRLRRPLDAILAGLLAGGAIWTKKEGLAAAALVIVALVLGEALRRHAPLRERLRPAIGAAVAAVVIPLPWLIFTHLVHPLGRDFLPLTPAMFVAHADRLPHIAASFALQMLDFANWSLLWLVLAGVLLLGARRLSPCGRGLLLLLAGQLAVYALAFVFSDWQPYTAHVQTSLDRLLAQATPLALLVLVEAVQALRTRAAASTVAGAQPPAVDEAA